MIYNVTNDFTQLAETAGTIQNNSYIYPVEVSDRAEADSGILLYPLNKFSFSGTKLYMRCVDGGAWAEIRVVPFAVDFGGTASTSEHTTDDPNTIVNSMWASDDSVDDADATINAMWNSGDSGDTGDGFSDDLNNLFG